MLCLLIVSVHRRPESIHINISIAEMKESHTPNEIASMLGYTARWIRTIVESYNRGGEAAILDHRQTLPGAPCLLSVEQQKELDDALDQPPTDGGLWSGPKVAAWIAERLELFTSSLLPVILCL